MSRPKVHQSTKVDDHRLRELRRQVALMKSSWVTVGVHEDAGSYEAESGKAPVPVSKVAFWLEQGTQAMPARPFFYPALSGNQERLKRMFALAAAQITGGHLKVATALGRIGFAAQTWIQNVIKSNVAPALSPAYAARRRQLYPNQGSRTLIASGLLLRSVRFKLILDGQEIADPIGEDLDASSSPAHDEHGRYIKRGGPQDAQGRSAARSDAASFRAKQKAQRAAAKNDPEGTKARFNAQHRAYITRPPGRG